MRRRSILSVIAVSLLLQLVSGSALKVSQDDEVYKLEKFEKTKEGKDVLDSLAGVGDELETETGNNTNNDASLLQTKASQDDEANKLEQFEETKEGKDVLDSLADVGDDLETDTNINKDANLLQTETSQDDEVHKLEKFEETEEGKDVLNSLADIGDDLEETSINDGSLLQTKTENLDGRRRGRGKDIMTLIHDNEEAFPALRNALEELISSNLEPNMMNFHARYENMLNANPSIVEAVFQLVQFIKHIFHVNVEYTKSMQYDVIDNIRKIKEANRDPATGQYPTKIYDKLVRADLLENKTDFSNESSFGFNESTEKQDNMLNYKTNLKQLYGIDLDQDPAPLPSVLGDSGCKPNYVVCDRREIPESCESLLPVEDQRVCGSGWAFAVAHQLSIYQCQKTGKSVNFSKQEILDCSGKNCFGGDQANINKWLFMTNHWSTEAEYPYEGKQQKCRAEKKGSSWLGEIDSSHNAYSSFIIKPQQTSYKDWVHFIKQVVSHFGSVVIHVNRDTIKFAGTVPMNHCEKFGDENHSVLLTGWDRDAHGREYFIFKNSWDVTYGDRGYGHMYVDAQCEEGKLPFWSIEVPLITGKVEQQLELKKNDIPGYSYMVSVLQHDDIDCTRYGSKDRHITILDAKLRNTKEFTRTCEKDVTAQLKEKCDGHDICVLQIEDFVQLEECANVLELRVECGDPRKQYVVDEEERSHQIKNEKIKFDTKKQIMDCNKILPDITLNDVRVGVCVTYCSVYMNNCPFPSVECVEFENARALGEEESRCDYGATLDTTSDDMKIDCSLTESRGQTASKQECEQRCHDAKSKHMCADNDMVCLLKGYEDEYRDSVCDIAPVWVDKNYNRNTQLDCNSVTAINKSDTELTEKCRSSCQSRLQQCNPPSASCVFFLMQQQPDICDDKTNCHYATKCDYSSLNLASLGRIQKRQQERIVERAKKTNKKVRPTLRKVKRHRPKKLQNRLSSKKLRVKRSGPVSTELATSGNYGGGGGPNTYRTGGHEVTEIKNVNCNAAHFYPDQASDNSDNRVCVKECQKLYNACQGDKNECFTRRINNHPHKNCNLHAATTGDEAPFRVVCEEIQSTECKRKCDEAAKQCSENDFLCYSSHAPKCDIPWRRTKKNCNLSKED